MDVFKVLTLHLPNTTDALSTFQDNPWTMGHRIGYMDGWEEMVYIVKSWIETVKCVLRKNEGLQVGHAFGSNLLRGRSRGEREMVAWCMRWTITLKEGRRRLPLMTNTYPHQDPFHEHEHLFRRIIIIITISPALQSLTHVLREEEEGEWIKRERESLPLESPFYLLKKVRKREEKVCRWWWWCWWRHLHPLLLFPLFFFAVLRCASSTLSNTNLVMFVIKSNGMMIIMME